MILRLMKRIAPGLDVKATAEEVREPDRRGARLRARGAEPALAGAHLPRPPVHRRARRGDRALAREGDRHASSSRGARLRRDQGDRPGDARPRRRDRLPLLLRLHVPPPPVLRRPAPGQLHAAGRRRGRVPRLRPVQGDAEGADRARARVPARRPRGRRRASCTRSGPRPASSRSPSASGPTSCWPSSATRPGGTCSTRRSQLEPEIATQVMIDMSDPRSAALRPDAPRDAARRPPVRPPRRDAHARRALAAARARATSTGSRASGCTATPPVTELGRAGGRLLRRAR